MACTVAVEEVIGEHYNKLAMFIGFNDQLIQAPAGLTVINCKRPFFLSIMHYH